MSQSEEPKKVQLSGLELNALTERMEKALKEAESRTPSKPSLTSQLSPKEKQPFMPQKVPEQMIFESFCEVFRVNKDEVSVQCQINGSQYVMKFATVGEGKGGIFKGSDPAEIQVVISYSEENPDFAFFKSQVISGNKSRSSENCPLNLKSPNMKQAINEMFHSLNLEFR
jgi:hypothetical protein